MYAVYGGIEEYGWKENHKLLCIKMNDQGTLFAVVTTSSIEVWSAGRNRVRVGQIQVSLPFGSISIVWNPGSTLFALYQSNATQIDVYAIQVCLFLHKQV